VGATDCPQGSGGNGLPPVGEADCPEVGATGCPQESSPEKRHRNTPQPPAGAQRRGNEGQAKNEHAAPPTPASTSSDTAAQALVATFYRGLGVSLDAATPAIRRRELAIAHQLVEAGATPAESEAYAREARAAPGRMAPIDLRSFERERLSWLARVRGGGGVPRLVDRTGQGLYGRPVGVSPATPAIGPAASATTGQPAAAQERLTEIGALARSLFGQRA
jgi:hypothetical protein